MNDQDRAFALDAMAIGSLLAMALVYDGDFVFVLVGWAAARLGAGKFPTLAKKAVKPPAEPKEGG